MLLNSLQCTKPLPTKDYLSRNICVTEVRKRALGFPVWTFYFQIMLCPFIFNISSLQYSISTYPLPSLVLLWAYIVLLPVLETPQYFVAVFALNNLGHFYMRKKYLVVTHTFSELFILCVGPNFHLVSFLPM